MFGWQEATLGSCILDKPLTKPLVRFGPRLSRTPRAKPCITTWQRTSRPGRRPIPTITPAIAAYTKHGTVDYSFQCVNGDAHTNEMENFWTLVMRCVKGTYVQVSQEHAFWYLEEESYRFNLCGGNDGDRFTKLIGAVAGKRLTYK